MYSPEKDKHCVEIASTRLENMVLIPAGKFDMGSKDTESFYEQLVHTVHVNTFYMDTHAVTNLEYQQFLFENSKWQKDQIQDKFHDGDYLLNWDGSNYPVGQAKHPVTSWILRLSACCVVVGVLHHKASASRIAFCFLPETQSMTTVSVVYSNDLQKVTPFLVLFSIIEINS